MIPAPAHHRSNPYVTAQLELARRELQRRRQAEIAATAFDDWLPKVTPEYTWDWRHLAYIRSHLEKVTNGELRKLMIFIPPRHGKCLAAGTPVLLADGREVPIEEISVGDTVVTLDNAAQPSFRAVTATFDNGMRRVRRLTFQSGRTLTCTNNHPLLTVHGWQEAGDLQVGDSIAAHRSLPTQVEAPLPEGFASLLGYLVGDGGFTKGDVRITNSEPEVSAHLEQIAVMYGWVVRRERRYDHRIVKPTRFGPKSETARAAMAAYMPPSGARDKRVPPAIFSAGVSDIAAFLAAYFNSDGSANKAREGSAEFYSISQELLRDVQKLLLRLGIQSRLREKRGRYLGEIHMSWRLIVSGGDVAVMADALPVIGERGMQLRAIAEQVCTRNHYPEYDAIPPGWKQYLIRTQQHHRLVTGVRIDKLYKHGTARQIVQKIVEAEDNDYLRWLCSPGLVWDRIVAVEDAGEQPTFDIEVAETHNFTVSGLIVHNSEMATIRYPVYRMERDQSTRVIVGCYNTDLANKFSRDSRRIAKSRGLLGPGLKNTEAEWEITGGGGLRTAAVGAAPTGRGADLIVIDDPVRSREDAESETYREKTWDWYTNDMFTRLEPGGAVILILTRWHEDDLAGRILNSEDGPNWTVCSLPAEAEEDDPMEREVGEALCPERFDEEALAEIRGVMGIDYYALYQQRPVADEGGLYKRAWFTYEKPPQTVRGELLFDYIIQAWDTASSKLGDWSACITAGVAGNKVYVLDVFRERLETPDLKREVETQAERWDPRVILIEDASSGIAIQQMLRRETKLPIVAVPPHKGGKLSHARANAPYFEGGRVVFCPGAYLPALERELLAFPAGANDDQVDGLNVLLSRVYGAVATGRAGSHSGSSR